MNLRGGAARQLRGLFESGALGALEDGELLRRFLRRDASSEPAFAALVARHGRMVRRVCVDVLGDAHDAEDAAQATFFVLARRGATIARPEALPAWLHGTALRIAARSLRAAIRRRKHERGGSRPAEGPAPARDWSELHEELGRLPARYREPIVLCDLAGLSHDQAASQLGAPLRTLQTRLYRGRETLKARLIRRGLAPSAALVGMGRAAEADARMAPHWTPATIEAMAGGSVLPGPAASLARAHLKGMLMAKLQGFATVAILAGIAAGGARSAGPAREPAAEQDRPIARPAPPPAPKDDFEKAYVLAEGEDIKALQGEAIEARFEHYRGRSQEVGLITSSHDDFRASQMTAYFRWRDGARRWQMTTTGPVELRSILGAILDASQQEFEGDLALLRTPIPADFLIRDGVPPEKLTPLLERIFREEFGLPVRLRPGEERRDVIVARGRFEYRPDPAKGAEGERENPGQIQIYAREIAPARNNASTKAGYSLDGLLSDLALICGVRFIDEVEAGPKGPLAWRISDVKYPATIPVEDQGPTLDHVTQQTGLTFTKEVRNVRFLRVERAE